MVGGEMLFSEVRGVGCVCLVSACDNENNLK